MFIVKNAFCVIVNWFVTSGYVNKGWGGGAAAEEEKSHLMSICVVEGAIMT